MPDQWSTLRLSPPKDLVAINDKITEALTTLNDFLALVKEALELAKLLSSLIATNPIEAALRALLDEIERFIDGLLQGTGAHAIFVPVQKKIVALDINGTPETPPPGAPDSSDELDNQGLIANASSTVLSFVDDASRATGGNAGFYRTLTESLVDEGDINRPRFTPDFAVAGGALVFGANSVRDLSAIIALLESFIKLGDRDDALRNNLLPLENLRAKTLPISTASPARIGVQLDWDKILPAFTMPFLSAETVVIEEIFVIRSTDQRIRESFNWNDVFPDQPSDDINILPVQGDTQVIRRIQNDSFVSRYIDKEESLVEDGVYYYAVAPRYSITTDLPGTVTFSLDEEILPMGPLSNVVRVEFKRPVDSKGAEPPDWIGTPSLAKLFPIIESLINQIKLLVAELGSRSLTGPNHLDRIIKQIEALLKRADKALAIIAEINALLRGLLSQDVGGISATVFTVRTGGMAAWTAELARRLSDTSDPSRPKFDVGDELVAGVVIVAGAPNLPSLTPFLTLLKLFLGSDNEPNPLLDAINAVDVAIADTEKIVFAENLTGQRVASSTLEADPPKVVFDEGMVPKKSINC